MPMNRPDVGFQVVVHLEGGLTFGAREAADFLVDRPQMPQHIPALGERRLADWAGDWRLGRRRFRGVDTKAIPKRHLGGIRENRCRWCDLSAK